MNDNNAQGMLERMLVTAGTLEKITADLRQQAQLAAQVQREAQESQEALRTAREQEEVRLKQAMAMLFQEEQQRTEAALRPITTRAWQTLAVLAAAGVLLFVAFAILIGHENQRLKNAQARAEAAEVRAEVQEALKHVEITSCGGHPCVKVDKGTPAWKGNSGEYILIDTPSGKTNGQRR